MHIFEHIGLVWTYVCCINIYIHIYIYMIYVSIVVVVVVPSCELPSEPSLNR